MHSLYSLVSKFPASPKLELKSYGPTAHMPAYGAYDFLEHRGYGKQVNNIRSQPSYTVTTKTGRTLIHDPAKIIDRRVMICGLLFKKDNQYMKQTGNSLLTEFYELCWTKQHAPIQQRSARMEKWHQQYIGGYKSRYGYLL